MKTCIISGVEIAKTFRIVMSERCFRFKLDALEAHAPPSQGVYEFVTFTEKEQGKIIYVGLAWENTIQECLKRHWAGTQAPAAGRLFEKYPDVYFDYVARANVASPEEWKDIAGELIRQNSPEFNDLAHVPSSGEYDRVHLKEVEIL